MTHFTRWLVLLVGGTLIFGLLCFGSGLLLGIYLFGESGVATGALSPNSVASRQTSPAVAAPAVPAVPTLETPTIAGATATHSAPAISVQPGGVQITGPAATVQVTPPGAAAAVPGAAASAPAAPAKTAEAPAAGVAAAPAASGAAPTNAENAIAVQAVPDLVVGIPPDDEAKSPLRTGLVAGASSAPIAAPTQAPAPPAAVSAVSPQAPAAPAGAAPPSAGANGSPAAGNGNAANKGAAVVIPPSLEKAAAAARGFAVRAGAYLDPASAQRRAEGLRNRGYRPLILSSRQADEGLTWYSVVLTPSKDLPAARREAAQFAAEQGYQPEIVSWAFPVPAQPPGGPPKSQ